MFSYTNCWYFRKSSGVKEECDWRVGAVFWLSSSHWTLFCLVCLKFVLFSQVEHEHLMLVLLPLDCIQFNRSSCSRYLTIMGSNQCLGRKVKQCKWTFHIYLFFHLLFSFFFIDSNFKDDKEKYYFIYSIVKTFRSSY